MNRYIVGSFWNRVNRNGINDNFQYLFQQAGKVNDAITQAQKAINEANRVNGENKNVQKQIDDLIINSGTSEAEVVQARGGYNVLRERLDEEFNFITNYNEFPQSPRPSKQGFMNNSTKFFRKTGQSAFELIQKANKGYLKYTFNTVGGGKDPSDAGVNHELIRLKKVEVLTEFYMYYDIRNPVSGSLTVRRGPGSFSEVETNLLRPLKRKDDNSVSSKANKHGIGTYVLSPNSEVEYELPLTSAKKMNIVILGSNQSSDDVDIMINDSSVVNINASSFNGVNDTTSYSYAVIEFPVPTDMRAIHSKVMKLKIKNNAVDKEFLFSALNFCELSNWKNERLHVNNYKGFGTSYEPFIDANGASDYALQDADGLYYGSYHGGEKLTYSQCNWPGEIHEYTDTQNELISFNDVPVNEWRLINNFKIIQRTNIDDQAEMLSEFNFDIDGTLEMNFGFYNSTMRLKTFYTALTCTSAAFNYVSYPFLQPLPAPNNEIISFPVTEGVFKQMNMTDKTELTIRYTKFNELNNNRRSAIKNQTNYRKFYYGPVQSNKAVPIETLSFSKGLDFNIN